MDYFLELDHIVKRYDTHTAVDRVSLRVPRGKIYGLLGPNGAGKTTTIRMITGILMPDEGRILFDGQPLQAEHAHRTGYLPEERGLYKKMKVRDQIEYLLELKGMSVKEARKATQEWVERLGLGDWLGAKTTDLSKGMQQKVQFIATVAHEPDLLILDEPFSGLDPVNAQLIEDEIKRLNNNGATILFSTHRMEQVEELCEHIALINRGKKILEDDITAVRKRFQHNIYRIEFTGNPEEIRSIPDSEILELNSKSAMVKLPDNQDAKVIMRHLLDSPLEILKIELHLPRLHEIFIELVGKDAPVAAAVKTIK